MADEDHLAIPAVRRSLENPAFESGGVSPDVDVRLLSEVDGEATFALGDTSTDFPSVTFAKKGKEWKFRNSSSNCKLTGWARGRKASSWDLERPVDPNGQRVHALVTELGCASAKSAEERIDEPLIDQTDDAFVVTISARQASGNQTCPGNPPTPFTFDLPEPLGNRTLLDGFHVPPAPPGTER